MCLFCVSFLWSFFWETFLATPPNGTKLSLGKLGRATNVGNSDYTSKTSLNSAGRDSGTSKTSLSDFYIGSVDNSLDGYAYVDEQTNETYTMTFGDENSLFESRIGSRHQNFTWSSGNDSLFGPQANQDYTAVFEAGAIAEVPNVGFISKSFEANLVTDGDFDNWTDNFGNQMLDDWTESGGFLMEPAVIDKVSNNSAPSSSNSYAVKFIRQDGYIEQTFTVKGNSTYEIVAHGSSSADAGQIQLEISGAYHQTTFDGANMCGEQGQWYKFRHDFYTSGSSGVTQNLKLRFTAVSASSDHQPLLDSVFFRRWEGSNFSDTEVVISGKLNEDGQSDGFNDHATRYNTNINKTVEIQDTYGGLSTACFLPDVLIKMSDGTSQPISSLNEGDTLASVVIPNLPDEDLGFSQWSSFTSTDSMSSLTSQNVTIKDIFYDFKQGYYNINNVIKVTSEHHFWVLEEGIWSWKTPDKIWIGSSLLNHDGSLFEVETINYINGEVEVVNINVEDLDVYFAGGVLVHNKGTNSDPA